MFFYICIAVIVLLISIGFNYLKKYTSKNLFHNLKGKNVLITGGSSGIGLSLAKLASEYGANLILCGRNKKKLQSAASEICERSGELVSNIKLLPLDVTCDFKTLEKELSEVAESVDILINCAGSSISRRYCDTEPADFEGQIKLNYLGSALVTRIILPHMISRSNKNKQEKSRVVFVSSMAGQLGLYGMAAYSASKFALRGLAESLRMELLGSQVTVTLAFPADTETPGFENEQIGKPIITKKLSECGGRLQPDRVANDIWQSTLSGQFFCYMDVDGWMLTSITYGMCLPETVWEFISLTITGPILRVIAAGYGLWMRFVVLSNQN